MSHAVHGLIYCWKKNLDYGPRLVADLSDEQLADQPAADLPLAANHPAWTFSHLNIYLPLIAAIIEGQTFDDPKEHPFGMQSRPQADRSLYPTKEELLSTFVSGHERVLHLLEKCDDSVLGKAVQLPRWQPIMPFAGIALPYLMLNHENMHLGQLSMWRRVQGMPSV